MRLPESAISRVLISEGERRSIDVESELHRGRHFVDVLPARSGGADEPLLDLAFVDGERVGDLNHLATNRKSLLTRQTW